MTNKSKSPNWAEVKRTLKDKSNAELLKLISDLYSSSAENKNFINARYAVGSHYLESYKKIISNSIYPDLSSKQWIKLSVGKKAITDYFKASGNELGKLELQMHYLEQGNLCTLNYGDIDERFYSSLESMFASILKSLRKQKSSEQEKYLDRLRVVVSSSESMGWGYHDCISQLLAKYENDV